MRDPRQTLQRISLLTNGDFLVGCVYLLSGIILVWMGAEKLNDLYHEFSRYFPITLPDNVADILLRSFPLIFKTFINAVGSVCAVVMGVLWGLTGLADAFEGRKRWAQPPDLEHPEVVAESLRSAQLLYWRSASLPVRMLGRLWARAQFISPVSYEMFRRAFISSVKIVIVGLVIAVIVHLLSMIPSLVSRFSTTARVNLLVPAADPLYLVLAFLVVSNVLIAASLLPFRKPRYERTCETVAVHGTGDPHLFFALLEEGCRLLSAEGPSRESPVRVEQVNDTSMKGTLTESYPKGIPSLARPAGYVCLPLVPILLCLGFSRLIEFSPALSPIYYTDFLSRHFLNYVLDVALGLAFVLAGVYFGEWARQLLGIRRFVSAAVFCRIVGERNTDASTPGEQSNPRRPRKASSLEWKVVEDMDDRFARWAKNPRRAGAFRAEICWGEIVSESAAEDSPRFLTGMRETHVLKDSMYRLIRLPFHVDFQSDSPETAGSTDVKTHSEKDNSSPQGKSTSKST